MKRFSAVGSLCIAVIIMAAAPSSPNKTRSAFSLLTPLSAGKTMQLLGETDKETITATISLSSNSAIADITVVQDGRALLLPLDSYAGITGAQRAWIEERGALTTLVIEGAGLIDGAAQTKEWRLALLFHPEQLWRRRLSVKGQRRDSMTFYNWDKDKDMETTKPKNRAVVSRGYHNN